MPFVVGLPISGDLYVYEQGSIKPYVHNDVIRQFRDRLDYLKYIYLDTGDTLYAATRGAGLLKIFSDGRWEQLDEPKCVGLILELGELSLFSTTPCDLPELEKIKEQRKISLFLVRGERKVELELLRLPSPQLGHELLFRLRDDAYLLWSIGMLYYIQNEKISWQRPYPEAILAMEQGPDGSLIVGHHFKKGLRKFSSLEAMRQGGYSDMLSGLSITSIYEDRLGKLWLTTLEEGVFYLPDEGLQVYGEKQGLSGRHVSAIAIKNERELFAGLNNGDVFGFDQTDGQFYQLPKSALDREIYDLEYDAAYSRLWKGAIGLQFRDEGRRAYFLIQDSAWIYWPLAYKKIQLAQTGKLWGCGAGKGGFIRVDRASGIVEFSSVRRPWGKERVFAVFEDFSQRVWVGKGDGLFEFRQDSLYRLAPSHPALALRVEEIAQLPDSTLVVGTKGGGLILWKDSSFVQLTTEQGLASNMIKKLHIDAAQCIWMGTPNGLNRITRLYRPSAKGTSVTTDSFFIETITMADGLPSNEINDIASWEGQAWVATSRGLVKLPAGPSTKINPPAPFIAQLLVNGQVRQAGAPPRLRWFQNNLQLDFLAINYPLNGKINYRYRLQPDQPWTVSRGRTVNYPQLPAGSYRFEVQAQDEAGRWSLPAVLPFEIRPPLWLRWWFELLAMLLLAGIGLAYYKNRTGQLKRIAALQGLRAERAREKLMMEQEMNRLRQSALRAQINPHFIFNCLNSIQSFIMDGNQDQAVRYLSRFARLIRLTLNCSLETKISLDDEVRMLKTYLELEKMRFSNEFEYEVEVEDNINAFDTLIPPLLIQPYVENALVHGLADATKAGCVRIHYKQENGQLLVTVTDNGIGIAESKRRKAGEAALHRSVGMTITEKRLELLNPWRDHPDRKPAPTVTGEGGPDHKPAVTVEEQKGENGEVLGTKVTVRIAG